MIAKCSVCTGTGLKSQSELCPNCQGSGYVLVEKEEEANGTSD